VDHQPITVREFGGQENRQFSCPYDAVRNFLREHFSCLKKEHIVMDHKSQFQSQALRHEQVFPDSRATSQQSLPETGTQCPDGFLTPREMVGLLRAAEDNVPLPADVEQHLRSCVACAENWAFIQATDPVLRRFREKRVGLLIQGVTDDEQFERVDDSQPNAETADRIRLIDEIERDLSVTPTQSDDSVFQFIRQETGELSVDDILRVCSTVQEIEDSKRRYETAKRLSALFAARVKQEQERGRLTLSFLDSLMQSESDSIDLSKLGVPVWIAAAFVASFPQTSYFSNSPVLEKSEETLLFHCARLAGLRREFDEVRKIFEHPLQELIR
jgi:hypothetical protein